MVFIFQFVNMVYHIDWFIMYIDEFLHTQDKALLIMLYNLLMSFWILFTRLWSRVFASMFISNIGL